MDDDSQSPIQAGSMANSPPATADMMSKFWHQHVMMVDTSSVVAKQFQLIPLDE